MLHSIYRLSDNGYVKPKFPHATKLHCLQNFISVFGTENLHLFVDETNLLLETKSQIEKLDEELHFANLTYYVGGSSAGSWRYVFDYALREFTNNDDFVYFMEDDHLHLPDAQVILLEGLQIADMVALYDHFDKYLPASKGGNPFIDEDGGELTKVYLTENSHWKLTNSTVMSFATTMKQLRADEATWREFTTGTHPHDMNCFLRLRELGRSLITPIPGRSTHCEEKWKSPLIDWSIV